MILGFNFVVRSSFDGQSLTDENIVANEVCGDTSATPTTTKSTALHSFDVATTEMLERDESRTCQKKRLAFVSLFFCLESRSERTKGSFVI